MSNKSFKIKDIFADHWDAFLDLGHPIRPAVLKNVDKIIKCGEPSMGHAIYHCDHCGKIKHVYSTCKSRFCNSCGAKYTQDCASSISSKLINCKHRHIVFTIPEELRIYFRIDRNLLHLLFQASANTVLAWFYKLNKSENFKPGIISTMHTFGRDLKWNPHIHMILTEGASGNRTIWRKISHIPDEQFKMIRYYGLYAKEYIHSSKLYLLDNSLQRKFRKQYSHWRARILLAFSLDPSIPPQPDCQVCDGSMTPKSYTGIRGVHYEYKK